MFELLLRLSLGDASTGGVFLFGLEFVVGVEGDVFEESHELLLVRDKLSGGNLFLFFGEGLFVGDVVGVVVGVAMVVILVAGVGFSTLFISRVVILFD